AQRAGYRHGLGRRGERVARVSVLRHLVPGRHEGDPCRAVRGGRGGRRKQAAAVPSRHAARHQEHHDHRGPALHDLDLQRFPDRLHPHQGGTRRHNDGHASLHVRARVRLSAPRRGDRRRALPAPGAGRDDHGTGALHAERASPMKRRGSATFETAVSYGVLVVLGVAVLFPFYWMIVTSFKNENQMRTIVSMFWPRPFAVENYQQLLAKTEFASWYGNSVFVAISSTLVATGVGTVGAYALARLRFLGRGFMASATLITYLVPPSILFIPLYKQMQSLGMANSLAGLIAAYPSFTVPFVTWLLMGYFESIPEELEEAAMIAGATRFGAFYRVVLPLSAPGVLAAGLYAFTQAWNEFLYA